jgi:8-oxo-dGTP pyrophosphatase MutT (NUDIX family)
LAAAYRRYMTEEQRPESMRWTVHGQRAIYDSRWVGLNLVDVQPPGGVPRFEHHVVRLHRVAIAAVQDQHDRVLMLWRHRFVTDEWGWELPGGIVEPGEDGAVAAARETEEETGWRPTDLRHLVRFQPMPGMVHTPHEVYLGREARFIGPPAPSEESGIVDWIPLSDVRRLMDRGELVGAGTLVGLLHLVAFRGDAR